MRASITRAFGWCVLATVVAGWGYSSPVRGPGTFDRDVQPTPEQKVQLRAESERLKGVARPLFAEVEQRLSELNETPVFPETAAEKRRVHSAIAALRAAGLRLRAADDDHIARLYALFTPLQRARYELSFGRRDISLYPEAPHPPPVAAVLARFRRSKPPPSALDELRALVKKGNATDAELTRVLSRIATQRAEGRRLQARFEDELLTALGPHQARREMTKWGLEHRSRWLHRLEP